MINGITQTPILENQKQIIEFKTPNTIKELQSFLGFANYYSKYIKDFANIAAPLYETLKIKRYYCGTKTVTCHLMN